jgi:hypothetical protein
MQNYIGKSVPAYFFGDELRNENELPICPGGNAFKNV